MQLSIVRCAFATLALFLSANIAYADVYMLDSDLATISEQQKASPKKVRSSYKTQQNHKGLAYGSIQGTGTTALPLIDASGLLFKIDTNITFSTTSSASGAIDEALYTAAVAATTLNGGTVASTLNDAFDGYNTICISADHSVANCETGNANFIIYNRNGAPVADNTCLDDANAVRQYTFNPQTVGALSLSRKIYVPSNDTFARWLNIVTNTGGTAQQVTLNVANNLGSDANTVITGSSLGSTASPLTSTAVTWVTSFQNYSGTTSSDVRLGHVLQGPGATVGLAGMNFVNGDDNPYWGYTFTVQPGKTAIIMSFVTGQPSKAAAASQAARLVGLPATATACMTAAEKAEVINFRAAAATAAIPAPGPNRLLLSLLAFALLGAAVVAIRLSKAH